MGEFGIYLSQCGRYLVVEPYQGRGHKMRSLKEAMKLAAEMVVPEMQRYGSPEGGLDVHGVLFPLVGRGAAAREGAEVEASDAGGGAGQKFEEAGFREEGAREGAEDAT